ncbi:RagB/SusD family nutrient uptake outer membrane protein [Parapedobacter pyrenivorans]|nr:RagB/SusD family nutrient uptake outer membrane protein [Parapedobacter pyrenivorans]
MNKKKHIIYWPVGLLLVAVLASCSDYLTLEELDNRTVAEGYYTSTQRVEQAVIGGYVDLRRALLTNHAWLMYGEARTGELQVEVAYYPKVAGQQLTVADRQLARLADWEYFYDVIYDANEVLRLIDAADGDVLSTYHYNLFKGEALALKSMAYFYIARIWGIAPSAEEADFGQPMDEAMAIERAAGFAREAHGLLPWILLNDDQIESAAVTAVRFNKTAAAILLAQENLWLGNDQEAYQLMADLATEARADSLSDFGLAMGKDERGGVTEEPLNASMVSISAANLAAIYPDGDARQGVIFRLSADEQKATFIVRDQERLGLLTINEHYLLMAEAAWKTGKLEEARTWLTEAADGGTENYSELTEAEFGDALLRERQRILIGSGQRFFDLKRFGKVSAYLPIFSTADIQNGAAHWPLAQRSLNGNGLTQHSYWEHE